MRSYSSADTIHFISTKVGEIVIFFLHWAHSKVIHLNDRLVRSKHINFNFLQRSAILDKC